MILTKKQEIGLKIAVERYKNHEKYTCIAGYAGAGKSTLIRFIIDALHVPEDEVCYVAFTGKAANVLIQKGCLNAKTAHKLLYDFRPLPDGKFIQLPKDELEEAYKIIVVDEISMLPREMWELLVGHDVYILACGDPAQLSPIDKNSDNHVLDRPHIFLDEIMRQAQESEIIRLTMDIRAGKPLENYKGKDVQIVSQKDVSIGMLMWADQIICATNNYRTALNTQVRSQKGFGLLPTSGDKIIGLRNEWDYLSEENNIALTNGAIGEIEILNKRTRYLPYYISDTPYESLICNFKTESGESYYGLEMDYSLFTENKKSLTPRQEFLMKNAKKRVSFDPPLEFTYGYAITCWKAQGSEWDKVLLYEEKFPFDKAEHQRYLYTGATRAKDKLIIVKKD